jgi:hypothetical protein
VNAPSDWERHLETTKIRGTFFNLGLILLDDYGDTATKGAQKINAPVSNRGQSWNKMAPCPTGRS